MTHRPYYAATSSYKVSSRLRRALQSTVSFADAVNLSEALNHARALGLEPNLFVTVQWRHAECETPPAERQRRLLNLIGTYLRRRRCSAVWGYSREVGKLKGEHVHLLLYVPPRFHSHFRAAAWRWISMEASGPVHASALRIDRIKGGLHTRLKRYLLKEGTDEVRAAFGVPATAKYRRTGGVVTGKRVKVSRAIDRAARKRWSGAK